LGRNSWKQKLRFSKEGEEEAMAMKKRNKRTREKRRTMHKSEGKGRKENQTVFCNGHCGQQKLPLQLTEEPGMGQQQSLFDFIILLYISRFWKIGTYLAAELSFFFLFFGSSLFVSCCELI
jgi:hypothetical protein